MRLVVNREICKSLLTHISDTTVVILMQRVSVWLGIIRYEGDLPCNETGFDGIENENVYDLVHAVQVS